MDRVSGKLGASPNEWAQARIGANATDADHQPAHSQAAGDAAREKEGAGVAAEPAKARRLHPRLYHHAEEAELGAAQSCEGPAHQRLRSDWLHSGRGPQSAGALRGDDPRRSRQGSTWRPLSHSARCARYARREKPQAAAIEIRSKEAEVIGLFA